MNIKRIITWIVMVAISVGCMGIDYYVKNKPEKENISVYTDLDSKYIVNKVQEKIKRKKIINHTNYAYEADGILTTDISLVNTLKAKDSNMQCERLYTTPLIIAADTYKIVKKTENSDNLLNKEYNNYYISINFKTIIDAIILDKKWSDIGVNNNNLVSVVCPQRNTVDGNLFEKFLIVTLNNGIYPTDETIDENIKTTIDTFFSKSTVIQCDDTSQRLMNVKDPEDKIYVIFENNVSTLSDIHYLYPTTTILKSYYYLYKNDVGKSFLSSLNEKEEYIHNNLALRTKNFSGIKCLYYGNLSDAINYVEVE